MAPYGGQDEMLKDLKEKVFAAKQLRYFVLGSEGGG
ncbi:MAG: hypothetical protein H7Y09_09695 [Chitinophagaceae bacterium]|nr:hypothetical protein [Anaerolineae bacterium]